MSAAMAAHDDRVLHNAYVQVQVVLSERQPAQVHGTIVYVHLL